MNRDLAPKGTGEREADLSSSCRFVPITDSLNFRHLGGYAVGDGRMTRHDMLFRSGWFELIDPIDVRRFESCAIERIFDLRTETDRVRKPLGLKLLPAPPQVTPLGIDKGSMGPYMEKIANMNPSQVDCKSAMTSMYYTMLDEATPQFRALFARILDATGPVLVLCSSGKDRTGVASALLLAALGVSKETIFQDFLISADVYKGQEDNFARRHNYEARGISLELIKDVLTVHPEYLAAAWRRAEELGGSMQGFLRDGLSLREDDLKHLKAKLTQ